MGAYREKISDGQLIGLLEGFNDQQETKIKFNQNFKQLKEGKPQSKVYHINNINNFHSKLKQFMSRFNGVATKYLDNYVNYYSEVRNNIDVFNQLLNINRCYLVKEIRRREVGF